MGIAFVDGPKEHSAAGLAWPHLPRNIASFIDALRSGL
jgi:hypothetical protein